jgi:tetratricopeptide (TPR) repeat protein
MRAHPPFVKQLLLGAAIALLNLLAYRQTLSFAPVHLDEPQLLGERWGYLRARGSALDAFSHDAFNRGEGVFYRPLLTLSFIADARGAGARFDPAPFHRTNLALQLLNALLCFALFARLLRAPELAAAGALLFSLHPGLAAASGWIPGRNDALLFTFAALALLLLTEAARRRSAGLFLLHLLSFLLALLTKETALALLLLFPVWALAVAKDGPPAAKGRIGPAAAALGWLCCAGLFLFLRSGALAQAPAGSVPGLPDLLFRAAAYAAYVFVPAGIPVYAWFQDLPAVRVALSVLAGLLLFAGAWWRLREDRLLPCAFAAGVLFLLPAAFSDRFLPHRLYLPVFFFALAATHAAGRLLPGRRLVAPALAAAALGLGVLTFLSLQRFRDPDAFWQDAHAASPSCAEALYELGYAAQQRGEPAVAERWYLQAIAGHPLLPDAHNNLGVIYKQAGRFEEALRLYEAELALAPGKAYVLRNLGNLFTARGDCPRAIEYYRRAIAIEPGVRSTYESLASCLGATGNADEAARYLRLALGLKPDP